MARGYYGRTVHRRLGLAERRAHVALGLRLGQRAAAVSELRGLAVLGPGQAQPVDRRRRRRRHATRSSTDRWSSTTTARDSSRPGLRHGDALHVGDLDPARPGLEVFGIHENEEATVALEDAGRGAVRRANGRDHLERRCRAATSGAASPPTSIRAIRAPSSGPTSARSACSTSAAQRISAAPPSANFAVWWDADPLREILDSNWIGKWDWTTGAIERLLTATGAVVEQRHARRRRRSPPTLRRLARGSDLAQRRTTSRCGSTRRRFPPRRGMLTLMHDPQYRAGDRLAERRLQPAAASGVLHRRRDEGPPRPSIAVPR